MMGAPRVYYAMARDGLFIKQIAALHPRFNTPARAIILQATLASLLVAISTFQNIVAYFFFITILFIALTVFGIFILRRKSKDEARPSYTVAAYPLTPILFLLPVTALLALLLMGNPKQALFGALITILGAPIYRMFFARLP